MQCLFSRIMLDAIHHPLYYRVSLFVCSLPSACCSWTMAAVMHHGHCLISQRRWWGGGPQAGVRRGAYTRSSQSLASENIRAFKTVMKPSLWWIGSHWRVCHLALADSALSISLSVCLSGWQMTAGATGEPPASRWSSICCPPWRIPPPPPPAVFQHCRTAVTAKTPATRRGLSHKTSKASAAMKTQARGGLVSLYSPSSKRL